MCPRIKSPCKTDKQVDRLQHIIKPAVGEAYNNYEYAANQLHFDYDVSAAVYAVKLTLAEAHPRGGNSTSL